MGKVTFAGVKVPQGTFSVIDGNPAEVSIDPVTITQTEGDAGILNYTYTISRIGNPLLNNVNLKGNLTYVVTGSGANPALATDFIGDSFPSGTVSFEKYEETKSLVIAVKNDNVIESDKEFTITLSAGVNTTISLTAGAATGTIVNNDASLAISPTNITQTEDTITWTYTVTKTGVVPFTTTINWAVTGSGTNPATASDFIGNALPNGLLSFSSVETTKQIVISVNADTVIENDKEFTVTLSGVSPTNVAVTTSTATGVISNDDATLAISPTSIVQDEGDSGTTTYTYTVTKTGVVPFTTTVDWAVTGSGGNPATASDFVGSVLPSGSLSFSSVETTKQIVVNVAGDVNYEADQEFTVTLSNVSPGTVTLTTATATGTITEDDAEQFNITLSSSTNNYNLRTAVDNLGYSGVGPAIVNVTVNGGVIIGSANNSTYAFDTGTFPATSTINITNNGRIQGAGGAGGGANGGGGADGGPALRVQYATSVTNNSEIWSGGGGGRAGSGNSTNTKTQSTNNKRELRPIPSSNTQYTITEQPTMDTGPIQDPDVNQL
ncbi:MAG: hypothetical protein HC836_37050 [Richelia sp. RM2_1_2]|nr:hypothetical protein [Richelia sp. RM2_1_2]